MFLTSVRKYAPSTERHEDVNEHAPPLPDPPRPSGPSGVTLDPLGYPPVCTFHITPPQTPCDPVTVVTSSSLMLFSPTPLPTLPASGLYLPPAAVLDSAFRCSVWLLTTH